MKQMKTLLVLAILALFTSVSAQTIYDYKVNDIEGKVFDMATLKGKKVLIVNTASKCDNLGLQICI